MIWKIGVTEGLINCASEFGLPYSLGMTAFWAELKYILSTVHDDNFS